MEELVAIARISKPRGLRGEVTADVLTDFPERFEISQDVIGLLPNGLRLELKIEKFFFQKGRIVLKIAGYDSIESAGALRNVEICIPETEAVELDEGEFFDCLHVAADQLPIENKAVAGHIAQALPKLHIT